MAQWRHITTIWITSGSASGLLPDDTKPLPVSVATYKLIQVILAHCCACIADHNARFCMDIYVSPCLWSHPHLRLTSHHFTYKVILQLLVHAFQITIPTFLYVYLYACLWVCNSHSHVHIYVSHIFIKMPNHLEGIYPMQPSDATLQQLGPPWLS